MFYILHGEEDFGLSEELARLRAIMAEDDPAMAELNTSMLDGDRLTLGELRHACDAIPFMTDRRLVVVTGLLSRLSPGGRGTKGEEPAANRAFREELEAYLPNLPPTARLVFVEDQELPPKHPILKVAGAEGKKEKAFVKVFKKPKDWELTHWIRERVQSKGGRIDGEATEVLAALVGSDLRVLDQELEKLLLYTDGQPVTAGAVRLLVSRSRETSIFDLVDCVGRRETGRALRLLHHLLDEGEMPPYLLAMLARQVRILIQVSELGAQGLAQDEMAKRLKVHPYVVKKGVAQAQNFQMAQLEEAHQRLVETDWSIKRGDVEPVVALDMLLVGLTRGEDTDSHRSSQI
jgi:DNA polymerase-3 subunit delta